jgi:hypothetical protein
MPLGMSESSLPTRGATGTEFFVFGQSGLPLVQQVATCSAQVDAVRVRTHTSSLQVFFACGYVLSTSINQSALGYNSGH